MPQMMLCFEGLNFSHRGWITKRIAQRILRTRSGLWYVGADLSVRDAVSEMWKSETT